MAKYVCSICGYEYDEATGDPDNGLAPGTKWEEYVRVGRGLIARKNAPAEIFRRGFSFRL